MHHFSCLSLLHLLNCLYLDVFVAFVLPILSPILPGGQRSEQAAVWMLSHCLGSTHHRLLKGMLVEKVKILNYYTSPSHSVKLLRGRSRYVILRLFGVGLLVFFLFCLLVL